MARKRAQALATPRTQPDTPPEGTLIASAVPEPVEPQAKGSVAPKVPTALVS
jgi:hypothetical protein